jgi:BirA family biotin operon repressor/biotin-[acetyl-CoA-carboxylase] ligase
MDLHADALASGTAVVGFETLGSTNAEALARGRAGAPGPLWITAAEQTAGRGRRGRPWVSGTGNLYTSLLLVDPAPLAQVAQVSFVAALALHDALVETAPALAPRLTLKWPNDLLGDGGKLAGILIEGEGSRPLLTVIGLGVNCRHHPDATEFPATSLAALGASVEAADLFTALSRHMVARLAQWDRGRGFAAIRDGWMARAFAAGTPVRARLPDRELVGRFETLDPDGRLVLRGADGSVHKIAAGDVFPVSASVPE